jgi:phosphoenolpyruvate carboxykinase (ATP)
MLFLKRTNEVDFEDVSITPNTRVSYQYTILTTFNRVLLEKSKKHIFSYRFIWNITSISKLTPGQAAYHFISGYTAKLGTEARVTEPQPNFSACFGTIHATSSNKVC